MDFASQIRADLHRNHLKQNQPKLVKERLSKSVVYDSCSTSKTNSKAFNLIDTV